MNYYKIGKILSTHGLKGEVKIQSTSDFNRFESGKVIYVSFHDTMEKLIINSARTFKTFYIVSFLGIDDIDKVIKYHSCELFVSENERDELPENEYYYSDLIGLKVYNEENVFRGTISEVIEVPQGHILAIINGDKKRALVPFRDEFIAEIDEEKIIVKEIEGLF